MSRSKIALKRVAVALCFALSLMTITWFVRGEDSPLKTYFLYHVTIPNFIGQLLIVPYFLVTLLRPSYPWDRIVANGSEFVQWLILGLVLALVIVRMR